MVGRGWLIGALVLGTLVGVRVLAAEQTPSEKAIGEAIKLLEKERDGIDDAIEQAKVDKAIRELEALIDGGESPAMERPVAEPLDFEVNLMTLKRKFAGKPTFNAKTGELTLVYDFSAKTQVGDFDATGMTVAVVKKRLGIDAGDSLTHVAKFRSFSASAVMTMKGMRGLGIASTNGSRLSAIGGKTLQLGVPGGPPLSKPVPDPLRSGAIPISLTVNPIKTSVRYGTEKLSQPTVQKQDVHQVVLVGGNEGCAFSNLIITGMPDLEWLKSFLEVE